MCPYFMYTTVSMVIKFESGETSLAPSLWDENILKYCSEMTLDPRLINEVNRGLKLGSELQLPKEHTFNYHHMADFIVKANIVRSLAALE